MVIKPFIINNKQYTASIEKKENQYIITLTVNGSTTTVIAEILTYNHATKFLTFCLDKKPLCVSVNLATLLDEYIAHYSFYPGSKTISIINPKRLQTISHPTKALPMPVLKSPLAGKVTSIFVHPGQKVAKGQLLLSIESMKMENEIRSTQAAHIKTLLIGPGDMIQPNQQLITFQEKEEDNGTPKNTYHQEAI